MDEQPTDVGALADLDPTQSKEDLARQLAELAQQLDEQEYEAFWDEIVKRRRAGSQTTPKLPK